MLNNSIKFFIDNKFIAWLLLLFFVCWGIITSPFDIGIDTLPRDPVSVDAIPNLGENQQIIFTQWSGRSPQDVEDQITYPLTSSILGIAGVKSVRSNSMFGFSSIYIIFDEKVDFYWSRSRILEKLNTLPPNLLPTGVKPSLGPDATGLGQIFWYTLEGRDVNGNPTGGWDLHELRTIQDFYVRQGLTAARGVAEVASIGGFVQEYQIDVKPDKMRIYDISLPEIMQAVKQSNVDVGAQTLEINLVEYYVRGLGSIKSIEDIENTVIKTIQNVPLRIKDIAHVSLGPAERRGVLDKSGVEAVGGVVVGSYGANPNEVIQNVKEKIIAITPGLPKKTLADGRQSQITLVPFYDRSILIQETLGTLKEALQLEILITILVVLLLLFNLRASVLVAGSLPVAVLMCFIAMRYWEVEANILALSGIVIAVGTMVDMGIVLTENMLTHLKKAPNKETISTSITKATKEVAPAIITALATTIVSFLPVFTMVAEEGKLFRPLAFTKTFALIASLVVSILILPSIAVQLFSIDSKNKQKSIFYSVSLILFSSLLLFYEYPILAFIGIIVGIFNLGKSIIHQGYLTLYDKIQNYCYVLILGFLLARIWMPLGVNHSLFSNFFFVVIIVSFLYGLVSLIIEYYELILGFLLDLRFLFLGLIGVVLLLGFQSFRHIGQEFMPSLDEGSFLLMPTTTPHAGMQQNVNNLRMLDKAVAALPEIDGVVGKAGRVDSALDPAPMSMYENIIQYKTEYKTDEKGKRLRFKKDSNGNFLLAIGGFISPEEAVEKGLSEKDLIIDPKGSYFRQWRDHIKSADDIWDEIVKSTTIPGLTSAPKLQPIQTRLLMLQTGLRSPFGIKVKGADLQSIEQFGLSLEQQIKNIEGVRSTTVFAEKNIGKPYLLIELERDKLNQYGLSVASVQNQLQAAIGGSKLSSTIEGRERYNIRLRYPREWITSPNDLNKILVSTPHDLKIPLGDLVTIKYEKGPQAIKSEDGFLVGYVVYDKEENFSEMEVVRNVQTHLKKQIEVGNLVLPEGLNYSFTGTYEQQVRANNSLSLIIPLALAIIFLLLYFQFRSVVTSLMVFFGILVSFSGGFILIWLYGQPWFLNFDFFGIAIRDLFQIKTINLSVAVWVGFLALFGIATDDGVLVGTFLKDSFQQRKPQTINEIRTAVIQGGKRRVKAAMMTTTTTLLALLPILTSTGRGADLMVPMALPTFGGMAFQVVTLFIVPILYALWKESQLKNEIK